MRSLRAPTAVLLAIAVVAGCSGLRTNTPVEPGLEVGGATVPQVRVVFPGPVSGASQDGIIEGFLRAGTASDGSYDSARAFLAGDASRSWNPDSSVDVLEPAAGFTIVPVDSDTVVVTAPLQARVDEAGRYTPATTGQIARIRLDLTEVNGEWRISSLPQDFGRWVPQRDLNRLMAPYAVYFVAADRRTLVPDIRWFGLDRVAARLARALLEPVPQHLLGTVTSAVPAGTRIAGDAVAMANGVATVNLISPGLPTDQVLRQNLWAQIVATVGQAPQVTAVQLLGNGSAVPVVEGLEAVRVPQEVGFPSPPSTTLTAYPLVRRGEQLTVFTPSPLEGRAAPVQLGGTIYPAVPAKVGDLALSRDGVDLVGVVSGRAALVRSQGSAMVAVPPFATELSPPRFDSRDVLWVGGSTLADGRQRLHVASRADLRAGRAPSALDVPWLEGRRIAEVVVSPAGDRVAVLSLNSAGQGARIDISGIDRDLIGRPLALGGALRLATESDTPVGLVWLGESSLATIEMGKGRAGVPVVIDIAGTRRELPSIADARQLRTIGGERSLVVITGDGVIQVRSGAQWISAGSGIQVIVPAG